MEASILYAHLSKSCHLADDFVVAPFPSPCLLCLFLVVVVGICVYMLLMQLLCYFCSSCCLFFSTSKRVPLEASASTGPNVSPPSVLILATGLFDVLFLSHHVTTTLLPSAANSASTELVTELWLRFILSPKVEPPSFEALNITSPSP